MEYLFHPTQDNIVLNQLHFILPSYNYSRHDVKKGIKKALKKFGCTSAILSKIHMCKHNCITKEKYEEMYKTDEESEKRMDLSVGEDLETFIGRIKNGEINKDTIPEHGAGDWNKTFLLCLLDKEERKKLEQKDYDFMKTFLYSKADVPEAEWKASESNMKFARSRCWRDTFFIDACNEKTSSSDSSSESSTYESSTYDSSTYDSSTYDSSSEL